MRRLLHTFFSSSLLIYLWFSEAIYISQNLSDTFISNMWKWSHLNFYGLPPQNKGLLPDVVDFSLFNTAFLYKSYFAEPKSFFGPGKVFYFGARNQSDKLKNVKNVGNLASLLKIGSGYVDCFLILTSSKVYILEYIFYNIVCIL